MPSRPVLILNNMGFICAQYFSLPLGWIFCSCAMLLLFINENIYLFLRREINVMSMITTIRVV